MMFMTRLLFIETNHAAFSMALTVSYVSKFSIVKAWLVRQYD